MIVLLYGIIGIDFHKFPDKPDTLSANHHANRILPNSRPPTLKSGLRAAGWRFAEKQ